MSQVDGGAKGTTENGLPPEWGWLVRRPLDKGDGMDETPFGGERAEKEK